MALTGNGAWRRLILICTAGALVGLVLIPLNPVHDKIMKLAMIGAAGVAWSGLLLLLWRWEPVRIVLLLVPIAIALLFVIPGRELDAEQLRDDYVRRMAEFEGTKYFWGGENSRGIDCSGLPRRAYRDALLSRGLRTLNGRALRAYAEQWWFDASARALGEGYRGYTEALGITGMIQDMDYGELAPGDLAVTVPGVHILAYAGEGKWIQADPGIGAVATLDGRRDDNSWFRVPVTIHRWRWLGGD